MQIRRGYRGGNEVKHNIFDSILSNTVLSAENIDNNFMYSDHNPVKLKFKLK